MKILAVDTSTRCGSLAILQDARVMAQVSSQEDTLHSERLFRDLTRLQAMSQFQLKEIDLFAVSTGPGSFTGLRVGLTAVKAWAELYQKPIAGVSGLLAVAAQSQANTWAVAPFLDARRGEIYGAVYQRSPGDHVAWHLRGEEALLSAEEFLTRVKGELGKELPTLVSPTPEALDPALKLAMLPGTDIESVSGILAPVVGLLGFEQSRRGELQDALTLDANYIRRSDAELFWKVPVMIVPPGLSSDLQGVIVRDLRIEDRLAIGKILAESPDAALWSEDSLLDGVSGGMRAWVAELNGETSGVLVGRMAADEFEILNLAVLRAHRQRGIASHLLDAALKWSRGAGTKRMLLEVRASNEAAIRLYARYNFTACGRRKQYYQNPPEDALLFARTLNEEF